MIAVARKFPDHSAGTRAIGTPKAVAAHDRSVRRTHVEDRRFSAQNVVHEPKTKRHSKISIDFDSTCLSEGTYNRKTEVLTLTFTDGSVYSYEGVDEETVRDLASAKSSGRFFNFNIRE